MSPIQAGRWCVLLSVVLLLVSGCSTSATSPDPLESETPSPAESPHAGSTGGDGSLVAGAFAAESLAPVYFDTDEALLRSDARRALESHAKAILAHPDWGVVVVEGHCDERGSAAYNQALGARRADAVKRQLVSLGVPADRIETQSFGKTAPAAFGHGESAWSQNRRSELRVETRVAGTP